MSSVTKLKESKMNKVQIYSKGYCPFCKMAKATLGDLGVSFDEFDITNDQQKRKEMIARSKRQTVPQIFIGEHHLGGNDDLQHALSNGSLKGLLKSIDTSA